MTGWGQTKAHPLFSGTTKQINSLPPPFPLKNKTFIYLFIYSFIYWGDGSGWAPATVCVWRSEDGLKDWILPFLRVGSRFRTQVTRLGGKCLYSPSHLTTLVTPPFFQIGTHYAAHDDLNMPTRGLSHPPASTCWAAGTPAMRYFPQTSMWDLNVVF